MSAAINSSSAIRRLYDAATDACKWPVFFRELARCFGADGAHIVRVQPYERTLTFSVALSPRGQREVGPGHTLLTPIGSRSVLTA
jgi:hypothetical protein